MIAGLMKVLLKFAKSVAHALCSCSSPVLVIGRRASSANLGNKTGIKAHNLG
jgi:hypothetical protein